MKNIKKHVTVVCRQNNRNNQYYRYTIINKFLCKFSKNVKKISTDSNNPVNYKNFVSEKKEWFQTMLKSISFLGGSSFNKKYKMGQSVGS